MLMAGAVRKTFLPHSLTFPKTAGAEAFAAKLFGGAVRKPGNVVQDEEL